jgi:hypothetical protein
MRTFNGVIFYKGDDTGTEVQVEKYVWKERVLVLYYKTMIEIIPYQSFIKAQFDKIEIDEKGKVIGG